jgi:hypothetical protein
MLVPTIISASSLDSNKAFKTPICANPFAPPPLRARPITGSLAGIFLVRPYGRFIVLVSKEIVSIVWAFEMNDKSKKIAGSIFLKKFTL